MNIRVPEWVKAAAAEVEKLEAFRKAEPKRFARENVELVRKIVGRLDDYKRRLARLVDGM